MIPVRLDFKFWTNSDYSESFVVTAENGLPMNLTGYTIDADWKRTSADPTALFHLNIVTSDIEGFRITDTGFNFKVDKETIKAAYEALTTNAAVGQTVTIVSDFVFTDPTTNAEVWIVSNSEINYGVTQ